MTKEVIAPTLFTVRNEPVVLDSDLALLYGVETRVFNQAIRRNRHRFPPDFAFPLTKEEWSLLRSQIVTLKRRRGQHLAASILNSERAVAMSVYVVRAFVKMRRELLANATLEARLENIEKNLLTHDAALRDVYQKLKPLLLPPPQKPKRRIGFHNEENPQ